MYNRFQTLNNRQYRTVMRERRKQMRWAPVFLWLSAWKCIPDHKAEERCQGKHSSFIKSRKWDQNSGNVGWLEAVVAQTSKEGVAMQKESFKNLPKSPTPSALNINMQICTLTLHEVWWRVTEKLWAE